LTGAREALNETAPFPTRWPVALDALAGARILPHYLGEAFCGLYLQVKRIEEARFNAAVTAHDHDWYFRVL